MWIELITLIIAIPTIVVFTIIKIKMSKSITKFPVTANMPLVENDYRKEFTEGYTLGVLKSIRKCKNGCSRIEFFPIDIEQGEDIPIPTVQSFIVKSEYIKPFGIGELSDYRQRIKTITRNLLLIPKKMRDSTEGKWVTKEGQLGYILSQIGKAIPAGDEAIAETMKEYARGQIAKAEQARLKEVAHKYNEMRTTTPEQIGEQEKKTT